MGLRDSSYKTYCLILRYDHTRSTLGLLDLYGLASVWIHNKKLSWVPSSALMMRSFRVGTEERIESTEKIHPIYCNEFVSGNVTFKIAKALWLLFHGKVWSVLGILSLSTRNTFLNCYSSPADSNIEKVQVSFIQFAEVNVLDCDIGSRVSEGAVVVMRRLRDSRDSGRPKKRKCSKTVSEALSMTAESWNTSVFALAGSMRDPGSMKWDEASIQSKAKRR